MLLEFLLCDRRMFDVCKRVKNVCKMLLNYILLTNILCANCRMALKQPINEVIMAFMNDLRITRARIDIV